jgi:regulator of replication initiation timing
VDNEAVQKETVAYQPIPEISSFLDENGNDTMEQQIQANYRQIKQDIVELVENELIRIENDSALKHLLGGNEGE